MNSEIHWNNMSNLFISSSIENLSIISHDLCFRVTPWTWCCSRQTTQDIIAQCMLTLHLFYTSALATIKKISEKTCGSEEQRKQCYYVTTTTICSIEPFHSLSRSQSALRIGGPRSLRRSRWQNYKALDIGPLMKKHYLERKVNISLSQTEYLHHTSSIIVSFSPNSSF